MGVDSITSNIILDRSSYNNLLNKSIQNRSSLDVSEFYQKQCKLMDELLKESPKKESDKLQINVQNEKSINIKKIEDIQLQDRNLQNKDHQILNQINKPVLLKNKIIDNLKHLRYNNNAQYYSNVESHNPVQENMKVKFNIIDGMNAFDHQKLEKSFLKNKNKIDKMLVNMKSKIPPFIKSIENDNKSRCISAYPNVIMNNSNNIRRVLNQDTSINNKNENSFLNNQSALPVIENNRHNINKYEQPIRLKLFNQIEISNLENKIALENHMRNKNPIKPISDKSLIDVSSKNLFKDVNTNKAISDKNIFEIKNLSGIYNSLNDKTKVVNFHYNENNYRNKLIQDKKVINERPFSHLNGKRININEERRILKNINMVHI